MLLPRPVLCALLLAACSPDPRDSGDDDAADAQAEPGADAAPFVDAPPLPPGDFTVYVHTADTLYKLDPDTLDPIVVGPFAAPADDRITDLAVAPDGVIYCISKTKLYRADATDGHVTLVAPLGGGPAAGNVGLSNLPDGTLLATDSTGGVRSIDPTSGAVAEIGAFGGGLATAGDLVAVEDGTMYGISDKGPNGNEFEDNWLITVNTTTGVGTMVGQIGYGRVFGAAFVGGKVLAFTATGEIVEIDPTDGAGTLRRSTGIEFWGAGVSPLVPGVE